MKKLSTILTAAALFLTLSCSLDQSLDLQGQAVNTAIPGVAPVALISADTYCSYYHGMGSTYRNFSIQVKNLAYDKQVAIYHKMSDGTWQEFPAVYSRSIPGNSEIWTVNLANSASIWGYEFVVKYTVNGVTYWDNNNGQNYSMGTLDGTWLNPSLNVKLNYRSLYYYSYTNQSVFSGSIDVRNLAYNKKVEVIYSTDNWQTTKIAPAKYVGPYYTVGYSQYINSPNIHGIERWTFMEYIGNVSNVEFAISYTVNGISYWDNNYGNNYSLALNQH